MATTITPTSSLTRYRPVILSITGFAACYGAYLVYESLTRPSSTAPLQRSNAVRRRRRSAAPPPDEINSVLLVGEEGIATTAETLNDHVWTLRTSANSTEFSTRFSLSHFPRFDTFVLHTPVNPQLAPELRPAYDRLVETFMELLITLAYELGLVRQDLNDPQVNIPFIQRCSEAGVPSDVINYALLRWMIRPLEEQRSTAQILPLRRSRTTRPPRPSGALIDSTQDIDGQSSLDPLPSSLEPATVPNMGERSRGGGSGSPEGSNIKSLLYYIAEEQANREGYVHRCVTCNSCETKPIRGIRWRCMNCADYDLCSDCEAQGVHDKTHIFYKIKIPAPFLGNPRQAQPVIYPGRPKLMPRTLSKALRKDLIDKTKYDAAELDAQYDQFTCLANCPWKEDPNSIGAAIDRRAFSKAFVPYFSINLPRPNLIYDRTFAFYDSDKNGLIGFEEFVVGLSNLRKMSPEVKLRHVFNGYDIDEDGYVNRKDFLRMFRAYYAIMKEMTRDLVAVQEEEIALPASQDLIYSSQPLASRFTEPFGSIDRDTAEMAIANAKPLDEFGDRAPMNSLASVIFDPPVPGRASIIGDAGQSRHGESRVAAVNERWRRRNLYTDEEEGFTRPDNYDGESIGDLNDDDTAVDHSSPDIRDTPSGWVSPRSRSSSKVRFQDDPSYETRSNASTSSRPVGERWGGYEIPEAEKDLGQEVVYQVAEQGFNELLDTLFKAREDLDIEIVQTKKERKTWEKEIVNFIDQEKKKAKVPLGESQDGSLIMARAAAEAHRSLERLRQTNPEDLSSREEELLATIRDTHSDLDDPLLATAAAAAGRDRLLELIRLSSPEDFDRLAEELLASHTGRSSSMASHNPLLDVDVMQRPLPDLLADLGATVESHPDYTPNSNTIEAEPIPDIEEPQHFDPTMPQYRPNSLADVQPTAPAPVEVTEVQPLPDETMSESPPDEGRLSRLALLDYMERGLQIRGGIIGRLSYRDFERIMISDRKRELEFVCSWLEVGSF